MLDRHASLSRLFRPVALLLLVVLAPLGCGPALGVGLGVFFGLEAAKQDNRPPVIVLGTVERWAGPVEIPMTVFDPEGDRVRFMLEYDLDDGNGFQEGTVSPGSVNASSGGTAATLIWEDPPGAPDYGFFGEIDLRITPRDDEDTGASVTTTILFGNDAPVVEVESIDETQVGKVPVFFTLFDSSSDSLEVFIEYKLEDGAESAAGVPLDTSWQEATHVPNVTEWPSAPVAEGGLEHLVLWDMPVDLAGTGYRGFVEVRVYARDHATANSGILDSNIDDTGEFFVRLNSAPVIEFVEDPFPAGPLPNDAYGYRVPFEVELRDIESDDCVIQVEYRVEGSSLWRLSSIGGFFESSPGGEVYTLEWNARDDLKQIGLPRFVGAVDLRVRAFDTQFGEFDELDEPIALNLGMIRPELNLSERDGFDATRIQGPEVSHSRFGRSVTGLGDINRNGFPDMAFGAWDMGSAGAVYLRYGGKQIAGEKTVELEQWDPQVEPDLGVLLTGEQNNQRFGFTVAALGDINGDGYLDFAIGAPRYDHFDGLTLRVDAGAVYIVFGQHDLDGAGSEISASALTLKIVGQRGNAHLGFSITGVGDVNGNGLDDFLIGSPGWGQLTEPNRGRAYLIYGDENLHTQTIDLDNLNSSQGMVITGETEHFLGYSVAGIGDVNGSGFDDILIGAPNFEENAPYPRGAVHLIYGDANLPGTFRPATQMDGNNGLIYLPPTDFHIGETIAGVGDVTGTGYADFLIGTERSRDINAGVNAAVGFLVYGDGIGTSPTQTLSGPDGTVFTEFRRGFAFAASLSPPVVRGLGDLSGDGLADFGMAFPLTADGAGTVHVIYGSPNIGAVADVSGKSQTDGATITGVDAGEQAGASLSALGDVDGDGYHAFIIGASRALPDQHGAAYVVYGGPRIPTPQAAAVRVEPSGDVERRAYGEVPDRTTPTDPFTHMHIEWFTGNTSTTKVARDRDLSLITTPPSGVSLNDLLPAFYSVSGNRSGTGLMRLHLNEGIIGSREPDEFTVYRAASPDGPWTEVVTVPFDDDTWYLEFDIDTATHGLEQYFVIEIIAD